MTKEAEIVTSPNGSDCCINPTPITSVDERVMAEVTNCASCGKGVDYRPLRPKDLPDALKRQEQRKTKKIKRLIARERASLESGTGSVQLEEPELPELEEPEIKELEPVPEPAVQKPWSIPCSRHGGATAPCDLGYNRANLCTNSKWGESRVHNGPCRCLACHARE